MTANATTTAARVAGEVIRTRLADPTFARRLRERFQAWEVNYDAFLPQVESVVLIALLATADDPGAGNPQTWYPVAAAALHQQQSTELFAALPPSLPDPVKPRVDQLRLLSTGLTPRSGHRWLRLCDTAREFLEPAALLEG
ncbi:hypothetical protein ACFY1L_52120 [Streptomyces sp. NPDC001663]|uniref:hypothetical protein n=1 Tax=Streptomyces sp. NPDC001663 TaxID=3364597 RepID=UPI0036B9450F